MRFEWDSSKNESNKLKHKISFIDAAILIASGPIEVSARNGPNGEKRTKAFGLVEGRCITVVYTRRGETYRIISARPASRDERREYGELLAARSAAEQD